MKFKKTSQAVLDQTVIGQSALVVGNIVSKDSVQLKGHVIGNIDVNGGPHVELAVLSCAHVQGDIHAQRTVVNGVVVGNISSAGCVELSAGSQVQGNITYATMAIAHGATLHGTMSKVSAEAGVHAQSVAHAEVVQTV